MAVTTISYSGGTTTQDNNDVDWTNASYAWDSNDSNRASCTLGKNEDTYRLDATTISVGTIDGEITKVEAGIKWYAADSGKDLFVKSIRQGPSGTPYVSYQTITARTSEGTDWIDITSGESSWTSTLLNGVDIQITNNFGDNDTTYYVNQFYLRVTYTEVYPTTSGTLKVYEFTTGANSDLSSDNFNDNSLDTDIWTDEYSGFGYPTLEQNNRIEQTDYGLIKSNTTQNPFDVSIKVVSYSATITADSASISFVFIDQNETVGNGIYIACTSLGNTLYYTNNSSGDSSSTTVPSTPFWMRMKYNGQEVTNYTSTNGTSWTQLAKYSQTINTDVAINLAIYMGEVGASDTITCYRDDFVNSSVSGTTSEELKIYTTTSGMTNYMRLKDDEGTGYIELNTTVTGTYASGLRVYKSGSWYSLETDNPKS